VVGVDGPRVERAGGGPRRRRLAGAHEADEDEGYLRLQPIRCS
jgi:hypothetical protein